MIEHYCMRYRDAKGMVSSHIPDDPRICGKPARFSVPSEYDDVEDAWYCADCWDFVIEFNRMQHERYGVPLLEP